MECKDLVALINLLAHACEEVIVLLGKLVHVLYNGIF